MPRKRVDKSDGVYQQSDRKGFIISWRDMQGRRKRRTVKVSTIEQARVALSAEKQRVEKSIQFGAPLPSRDSFAAFADEFLKHQEKRVSPRVARGKLSQGEFVRQQGIIESHLKPFFKDAKLAGIRRSDVISYIHKRTGAVSDGSVIKEVNCLKRIFSLAVELEKIPSNPAHKVPLPAQPEGRCRFLTPDELHKVLKACPPWLLPVAGLAVALGARRGELLAVRVADVDMRAGIITLRRTKNGKTRPAFINSLARTVLESLGLEKRKGRELLFPDVTGPQVTVAFIRACEAAGVEDFSIHDLRHCFASQLRMNGADLHDIQILLGHSDTRMTLRYSHLTAAHLDNAAHRLDGIYSLPAPEENPIGS